MSSATKLKPYYYVPDGETLPIMQLSYARGSKEKEARIEPIGRWHEVRLQTLQVLARFSVAAANEEAAIEDTLGWCSTTPGIRLGLDGAAEIINCRLLNPDEFGYNVHILGDPVRLKDLTRL